MFTIETPTKCLVLLLGGIVLGPAAGAQGRLGYAVPEGWREQASASPMRVTEFVLPRADGDTEDASLVVYYFGGGGGTIDANLARWIGQMVQPDGRPSQERASTTTFETNGMPVTVLDVPGTFVAETMPGSGELLDKPGFRLKAAVVESAEGPYFFKLTGPNRTVVQWDAAFTAFLKSVTIG